MRSQPVLKLARSPLVFVLVQVKFPAMLKMGRHIADIQEALVDKGLTKYIQEQIQQVVFGPHIKTEQDKRWLFASRDGTKSAMLTKDFLVYQTTRYEVFETFLETFVGILDTIKTHVRIDYAEQIGLRYIDLVLPTETSPARNFVRESLRGLSTDDLDVSKTRHQCAIQAKTQQGDLFIKSFENCGKKFMPPDLDVTHLKFDVEPAENELFRILDFDHIFRGEVDFDSDTLKEKLWALHDQLSRAFIAAVTEEAVAHWTREP
jgi:uncharacterized protein (TIGR04255 family)